MKILSKLLMGCSLVVALASCETYGDPEVGHTAVAPLDGRWVCLAYDYDAYQVSGDSTAPLELIEVYSSNTTNNSKTEMWMHVVNPLVKAPYARMLSVKVNCNVRNKTFSMDSTTSVIAPSKFNSVFNNYSPVPVYSMTGYNVALTGGQVILNGWETATSTATKKYYSDKIIFTLEYSGTDPTPALATQFGAEHQKYVIVGNRYTGWSEDYGYIADFINAY